MTDPERATAEAVSDQLDELLAAADGPPTSNEAHPPREPLDREQREIKLNVLRMGALVEDAIRAAIAALVNHDTEAALAVIVGDGRINEAQRAVSTQISRTIATQQPVARDLRFLLSLDHVTYELERMGDHAASVAKQARKLAPEPPLKEYVELPRMGELGAELVHGILRALVDIDQHQARAVAAGDDEIDALYHKTFAELIDLMRADPDNVERGMRILLAAHYLERIGDHAASVAKQARKLAPEPPLAEYVHLPRMGELGAELVHGILRALVDIDQHQARAVAAGDDEIDALYHKTFAELIDLMREDPDNVERGARIMLAAHYLERIGDRVTNIAEDVVFLASGEVEDLNP